MSAVRRTLALVVVVVAAATALGQSGDRVDPRSHELLDHRCSSELDERHLTLFGNGTVRLWTTVEGERRIELGELGPDELAGYRRRIRAEELGEIDSVLGTAQGDWISSCTLTVELEPGEVHRYRFDSRDTLPLALGRLVRIAEELESHVRPAGGSGFPVDYEPRAGDVLERGDGRRYVIVGFTTEGKGIELEAIEQPITVYTPRERLRQEFVELVRRGE